MIEHTYTFRELTAEYPFEGDPNKTWFCEIRDSNLAKIDGQPRVNYVKNGKISITCAPRQLNAQHILRFTSGAEEVDIAVKKISRFFGLPKNLLPFIVKMLRRAGWAFVGLLCLSVVFAVINHKYDISGFLDQYQKWNAANGARVVGEKTNEVIDYFNDPFFESEGVKYIEAHEQVDMRKMLARADNDLYVMKNVFTDKNDNPVLFRYGEAVDKCESLGGFIGSLQMQGEILPRKTLITVNTWSDVPEWASDSKGWDDYAISVKAGQLPDGAYKENGVIWGDDGDVKAAARCFILRNAFLEAR